MFNKTGHLYRQMHALPKAELHAHLNGSVSLKSLDKLMEIRSKKDPSYHRPVKFDSLSERSLSGVFEIFSKVIELVDNDEAVYMITCDVIEEFAEDNVKYLELRSSPKSCLRTGMTQESYVAAILKAIEDSSKKFDILVKLLISIDRTKGVENAQNCLRIAQKFSVVDYPMVVGMDLSGRPEVDGAQYYTTLKDAKDSGLKLSIHLAEVPGMETETKLLLNLPPDRIGHGVYLHEYSDSVKTLVEEKQIPLELCLTSNVLTNAVKSYESHHFCHYVDKTPLVICTDDKGVFQSSLSQEYTIAAQTFQLDANRMIEFSKNGFKYAFLDETMKNGLISKYFT